VDKLVGDGTTGTIIISVEDFVSAKWGPQVRSKLLGVVIDKLIVFEPKQTPDDRGDLPV
jgi:hypothetical protein